MELYIFNKELEFQGIVDAYTSFRWVKRFYKIGECELHVELTPKTLELLKLDNFIVKKDDTEPCIITYRNLKLNEDGTEVIVVKGLFAKSILSRRIILYTKNFYKELVTKAFFELLADGIMYGTERRQIINIFMGQSEMDPTLTETFTKQMSYTNLLESIEEVTRVTGVGTRLDLNVEEKMLYFEMYKPKNRTIAQDINPVALFSPEFDNVLEQEFIESNTDVATTAVVGGEGEGTARVVEISGDEHFRFHRKEIFVDARDLQKKDSNDVLMTDEQYAQLLLARGQKALEECKMVSSFTSKININQSNLVYKKDYDLGDTVTCINKKWGIKIDTQITEVEEVYENNTKEIYIVFGEELPTIMDKIRRE